MRELLKLQLYRPERDLNGNNANNINNTNNLKKVRHIPFETVEEIPKENVMMIFIDKLVKARLFEGDPYEEDFFSCDEALDFYEHHLQEINSL